MMKPESDPVSEDEWLLRRVRAERFNTLHSPIISPGAFEPRIKGRDIDHEGISLYREACLSSPLDVLQTLPPDRRNQNAIVRVPVQILTSLALTVVLRPDPRVLGHVVIPELNAADFTRHRPRFSNLLLQLAILASEPENIVLRPEATDPSKSSQLNAAPEQRGSEDWCPRIKTHSE